MTRGTIGIRLEDKNKWEGRAPVAPKLLGKLVKEHGVKFIVQPSSLRVYSEKEYEKEGATISMNISDCNAVLAVKEIPIKLFEPNKTYMFFSHVIKGQHHNMPMLKKMMELRCSLIDYEKVVDDKGRRLIFFSRHAGIAGITETFWSLGKRLQAEGLKDADNLFLKFKRAYEYGDLKNSQTAYQEIAKNIKKSGFPSSITPLVVGITGYGNVSKGVQELLDILPVEEITPDQLLSLRTSKDVKKDRIYKVVFKEEHMVKPRGPKRSFNLQEYYKNPELYEDDFDKYLPLMDVLVNAIYWDVKYPRVISKKQVAKLYKDASNSNKPILKVIGDISCDIEGGVEFTSEATMPDKPVYVYDVKKDVIEYGVQNLNGPVVMAVDNLPCEIAKDSTEHFGNSLFPYLTDIANADYTVPFDRLDLPSPIKGAVILYQGVLTDKYKYIQKFL